MASHQFSQRLFRGSLIYSLGGIGNAALSFALLPVYSKNIPTAEFGAYSLLVVAMVLCEAILNLGVNGSMVQVLFKGTDEAHRKRIINTIFWFSIFFPFLFLIPYLSFRTWVARALVGALPLGTYYLDLAVINGYFLCEITVANAVFRIREQAGRMVGFAFLQNLLKVISILYLVRVRHFGVEGIFIGSILSSVAAFGMVCTPLIRYSRMGWSIPHLRAVIVLSIPLIPTWLVNWGLTFLDKIFLKQWVGLQAVGIYTMALQISSILSLALTIPFTTALHYLIYATEEDVGVENEYAKVMNLYLGVGTCLYMLFVVCSVEIYYFFISAEYLGGLRLVPVLALSPFLIGLGSIMQSGSMLRRKNYYFLAANIAVYIGSVGLNFILVKNFASIGAAVATATSSALIALLYYLLSQRVYPIRYPFRHMLLSFGFIFSFMYIFYTAGIPFNEVKLTPLFTMVVRSVAKLALSFAFVFLVYRCGIMPTAAKPVVSIET